MSRKQKTFQRLAGTLKLLANESRLVEVLDQTSSSDLLWMASVLNLSKSEEWTNPARAVAALPETDRTSKPRGTMPAQVDEADGKSHAEQVLKHRISHWVFEQLQTQEIWQASTPADHRSVRMTITQRIVIETTQESIDLVGRIEDLDRRA